MYCPVLVSTNISSPVFTNNGTLTTAPVSRVAGFDPPGSVISDYKNGKSMTLLLVFRIETKNNIWWGAESVCMQKDKDSPSKFL